MDDLKKHLTEIRPYTYVANSDPNYVEKCLKFFPKDRLLLYNHAHQLLDKGKLAEGIKYLQKSSDLGYIQAKRDLELLNKFNDWPRANPKEKIRESSLWKWLLALFLLVLFLFILLAGWKYIENKFFIEKNDYFYQYHEYHQPSPDDQKTDGAALLGSDKDSIKGEVPMLAASNAIFRYKEMHGAFPASLDELTGGAPSNFLSKWEGIENDVPAGLLNGSGESADGGQAQWMESRLELHFYPEANKLLLVKAGAPAKRMVLGSFTVASGKQPLPFDHNKVSQRVVNPNGGDRMLGTRGLVLSDGYAIHGTNDPLSIGKKVTHGCIRLSNADIETLYPYVSIGTPFVVEKGLPDPPLFASGLPQLKLTAAQLQKEEDKGTRFIWRN
ncbi:L,D-transpeptidase [Falsibacillus albus]|uniref:L,D-transpeptidase n=1 Tax=Falsibacillus albus TaxID=2478915 RepID=A0A3L7JSE6_9BACI|nr:L,D-transpeptidase [Falsibacillus albus]RLQ93753.1 L,D-transpeptidase [Falsibacillus albus]